ncbi:MAG TPA: hypothetical protein VF941_10765 [Clostridia bacterium]
MLAEGHVIDEEILSCLSPYIVDHINRSGLYEFDLI